MKTSLMTFLRGKSTPKAQMPGCSSYDHHYSGCLYADYCLVEKGQRCAYFERSVMPAAADTGQKDHIYALYEAHVGIEIEKDDVRLCPDCEAELQPRQRLCFDCARKRQLRAKRVYKRRKDTA